MTKDGNNKALLTYLVALTGIAIMALGIAVLLSLYHVGGAGKAIAIAATAVGGLIAIGPSLMRYYNKEDR
jgi:hypothetical protein